MLLYKLVYIRVKIEEISIYWDNIHKKYKSKYDGWISKVETYRIEEEK